jgi:hypothetical protein
LNKLKEAINVYIYRPIHHTAVDKESPVAAWGTR